jgi:hypothetical protein
MQAANARPLRIHIGGRRKAFSKKKGGSCDFQALLMCRARSERERDKNTEFSLSKIKLPPCYFSIFKWERFVAACAREALVRCAAVLEHDTKLLFMCSLQLQHLTFIKKLIPVSKESGQLCFGRTYRFCTLKMFARM